MKKYYFSQLKKLPSVKQEKYNLNCDHESLHQDAKKALRWARTPECLQLIADTACANQRGTLYPPTLKSLCNIETDDRVAGHHMGCYIDSTDNRLLNGEVSKFKGNNSPKK